MRLTFATRNAASTAFGSTSMIFSGLPAVAMRLLPRSHRAMPRRHVYGSARKRRCQRTVARDAPESLIADVVCAELVAVEQQRRRAATLTTICSGRSVAPDGPREALPQQEVAVAGNDADRHAGPSSCREHPATSAASGSAS